MDLEPHSSIAILAEIDQAILTIFDPEIWRPITLLLIVTESSTVPFLKDLIHIYLELENQDLSMTFKVLYFNLKGPHFAS